MSQRSWTTHCCRKRLILRTTGLPWNLTFAEATKRVSCIDGCRTSRSQFFIPASLSLNAACTYRFAFGPRAGQKVLMVQAAMPRDADFKQPLCADIDGFSQCLFRAWPPRHSYGGVTRVMIFATNSRAQSSILP